jgi:hypothetical protein
MAMSKNSIQTQCHKLREPLSILIKYKTTVTPKIFENFLAQYPVPDSRRSCAFNKLVILSIELSLRYWDKPSGARTVIGAG